MTRSPATIPYSRYYLILAPLFFIAASVSPCAAADPPAKKVVFIAGAPDANHTKGTHEYAQSVRLLQHCLDMSPNVRGLKTETHFNGWPKDPATLDTADTIVVVASGSDRNEKDHPLLAQERLAALDKQMRRGCGLVLIHWCTFFPNAGAGEKALEWVGGHFDYQSGPPPRNWASAIQTTTFDVKPGTPDHPVCRGLTPFRIKEEFYYQLKFRTNDSRLKPVLKAKVPGVEPEQTVAWTVERQDGGRGFGFTGGPFFSNWWVPEFRQLVLNAIVWTAKAEVPAAGVESTPPRPEAFQTYLPADP